MRSQAMTQFEVSYLRWSLHVLRQDSHLGNNYIFFVHRLQSLHQEESCNEIKLTHFTWAMLIVFTRKKRMKLWPSQWEILKDLDKVVTCIHLP